MFNWANWRPCQRVFYCDFPGASQVALGFFTMVINLEDLLLLKSCRKYS